MKLADRSPTPMRERQVAFNPGNTTHEYDRDQPAANLLGDLTPSFPPLPPLDHDMPRLSSKQKKAQRYFALMKNKKPPAPWKASSALKGVGKGKGSKGKGKFKGKGIRSKG